MAAAIEANQDAILAENEADVKAAEGNIDDHLMNRLRLKPQKIQQLAKGIRSIAAQDEPLRKVGQAHHAQRLGDLGLRLLGDSQLAQQLCPSGCLVHSMASGIPHGLQSWRSH